MTTLSTPEVPIRRAASVLLLRETGTGLEVFVQHRVHTMDFAAGVVVYPGGRVDAQDARSARSDRLDHDLLQAHTLRWAHTSVWADGEERATLNAAEILTAARREVLEETGLQLDMTQLTPWANWVTPPGLPRRFDTYFFVAGLRPGQEPRHQTSEAFTSRWIRPEALFAALERGEVKMMRPTQRTLRDAMELGDLEQILSSTHEIRAVHPDPRQAMAGTALSSSEIR